MLYSALTKTKRGFFVFLAVVFGLTSLLGAFKPQHAKAVDDTVYSDASIIPFAEDQEHDDDLSDTVDLPFDFNFYGTTFDTFRVSTNGALYFDFYNDSFENVDLSQENFGSQGVYLHWGDLMNLYPVGLNNITTKTIGDAPNRQVIIQWANMRSYEYDEGSNFPFLTAQIILNETTNTIQYQYKTLKLGETGKGKRATVGIQDIDGHTKQYSYDTASLSQGQAISFTPSGDDDYTMNSAATYNHVYLRSAGQAEAPELTAPADQAVDVDFENDIDFNWTDSDNTGHYQFFLSDRSDFSYNHILVNEELQESDPTYTVTAETLPANKIYYWFVENIKGENGTSEVSPVHSFTMAAATTHNIGTCAELRDADDTGTRFDTYKLTADIDCDGINFIPLGDSGEAWTGDYKGFFNGQSHKISNLNIDYEETNHVGMFKSAVDARLIDATIESGTLTTNQGDAGMFVGHAQDTQFTSLTNKASMQCTNTCGGIVGYYANYMYDGTEVTSLSNLVNTGDIEADNDAGGIMGGMEAYPVHDVDNVLTLDQSYNIGNITTTNSDAGGLLGWTWTEALNENEDVLGIATAKILNSYSRATISSTYNAGGLVAWVGANNDDEGYTNSTDIYKSYAVGSVTASDNSAGGLVGYDYGLDNIGDNLIIHDSFSAATLDAPTGKYGLVGSEDFVGDGGFVYSNNWFDKTAAGTDDSDYLQLGNDGGVAGNSQFKGNNTNRPFVNEDDNWNFTSIWLVKQNDYPALRQNVVVIEDWEELESATDGAFIKLEQSGCVDLTANTLKESDLSKADSAFDYPAGLVNFTLGGCNEGGQATITLTFVGNYDPAKLAIRKYNSVTKTYTTLTNTNSGITTTKISYIYDGPPGPDTDLTPKPALKVVYHITDGGALDQDGTVNGTIVDPVGPAATVVNAPDTGFGGSVQ